MPKDYLAMKSKFMGEGMDKKDAEGKAARIHNARDPEHPVGRHSDFAAQDHLHEKIQRLTARK